MSTEEPKIISEERDHPKKANGQMNFLSAVIAAALSKLPTGTLQNPMSTKGPLYHGRSTQAGRRKHAAECRAIKKTQRRRAHLKGLKRRNR